MIPRFLRDLESAGFHVDYFPEWSRVQILENISSYHGLIFRSHFVCDQEIMDAGICLSFLGRIGSGLENVDLDYATKRGICVYRSPEGNAAAVAEHAIGMILALMNKLLQGDQMVRSFNWDREAARGYRLEGKTVGLIGYGHVGKAMAMRLKGFNVSVLAYDKYLSGERHCVAMKELFRNAQIISLHVPLTDETHHLVNDDFIDKMDAPFYLINTSRGGVVSTEALLRGLDSGKIIGAALDVFENEKMQQLSQKERMLMQRLCNLKDVILSPHVAGWNDYSKQALHNILFEKIVEHEER